MEFSEIQISVTALFLLAAVGIVVLCNVFRNKTQRHPLGPQLCEVEPIVIPTYERRAAPPVRPQEPPRMSMASEIAALASLGMREENSAWRKADEDADSCAPADPLADACKALQRQPVTIDEFLFDLLVSGKSAKDFPNGPEVEMRPFPAHPEAPKAKFEVMPPQAHSSGRLHGMISEVTLRKIVAIGKPFTGVALAICINEDETGRRDDNLLEWVCSFIGGLLREDEFACRTGKEEFLIVCPGVRGAEAQRRLNSISERLWDFQLRGIGTHSILFSWGGVEAQNQPLADAIASATDRMRLTRRIRNPIYLSSADARGKIV